MLLLYITNSRNYWIWRFNWRNKYREVKLWIKKKIIKIRIYSIFWMYFGCFSYSYIIGSLSSLLSNLDTKYDSYRESLNTFLQIQKDHPKKIDKILCDKIKSALKYEKFICFLIFYRILKKFNFYL